MVTMGLTELGHIVKLLNLVFLYIGPRTWTCLTCPSWRPRCPALLLEPLCRRPAPPARSLTCWICAARAASGSARLTCPHLSTMEHQVTACPSCHVLFFNRAVDPDPHSFSLRLLNADPDPGEKS